MTTLLTSTATRGLGFSPTIRRARQEMQAPKPALDRKDSAATPIIARVVLAEGRIGQSDRLIVGSWAPEARRS